MALVTRSATIQVRVVPLVKQASERVLWRLGMTMSEAVELFLRRVITEERIPFDIVALEAGMLDVAYPAGKGTPPEGLAGGASTHGEDAVNFGATKKEFKKFFGARTSSRIRTQKPPKKSLN